MRVLREQRDQQMSAPLGEGQVSVGWRNNEGEETFSVRMLTDKIHEEVVGYRLETNSKVEMAKLTADLLNIVAWSYNRNPRSTRADRLAIELKVTDALMALGVM